MNSSTLIKLILILVPISIASLVKWSKTEPYANSPEQQAAHTEINWRVETPAAEKDSEYKAEKKAKKKLKSVKKAERKSKQKVNADVGGWFRASHSESAASQPKELKQKVSPFKAESFAAEYFKFWDRWTMNSPPMRDDDIQVFLDRAGATVAQYPLAMQAASELYRSFPISEVFQRYFIREILKRSDTGKAQLLKEAEYIHTQERTELYNEMFQIYRNYAEETDHSLIIKALAQITPDAKPKEIRPALHYLKASKLNEDELFDIDQTIKTALLTVVEQNDNNKSVAIALQNLYRLNTPDINMQIALNCLTSKPSAETVMETIHAIRKGNLELTIELKQRLTQAVERPNVSQKELKALQNLFSQGPNYSKEADYI